MGYEVLDAEGADIRLPEGEVRPQDVVPIDDLVQPAGAPDDARRAAAGAGSWSQRWVLGGTAGRAGSWSQRLGSRVRWPAWLPRGPRALVACATVVALVLGVVAGGWWTAHLQTQDRAAARRSQLQALAMVTSVDSVGEDRGHSDQPFADVTVRVVNAGPLPLEIVMSPRGSRATVAVPLVRDLGGAHTVPAGDMVSVNVRLAVDCAGVARAPRQVWLPVRTADGTVHHLTARTDALDAGLHFGQAPCAGPPGQSLVAELAGSIGHPLLRLKNISDRTLEVTLDVDQSPFVAQSANFSVLRLTPALPQKVAAGGKVDLAVLLTPWSCPSGLSEVLSSQLSPYVVLRVGSPGADVLAQEVVGVDLSTVWGAALARDCS